MPCPLRSKIKVFEISRDDGDCGVGMRCGRSDLPAVGAAETPPPGARMLQVLEQGRRCRGDGRKLQPGIWCIYTELFLETNPPPAPPHRDIPSEISIPLSILSLVFPRKWLAPDIAEHCLPAFPFFFARLGFVDGCLSASLRCASAENGAASRRNSPLAAEPSCTSLCFAPPPS